MDREKFKAAVVTTMNTVVPDLRTWVEALVTRGHHSNLILIEFRRLMAGNQGAIPSTQGIKAFSDEELLAEFHARLAQRVVAEVSVMSKLTNGQPALDGPDDLTDTAP